MFTVSFTETEAFKTFFYAGELKLLYFLMILMLLDVLTGLAKAIKNKTLWSRKSMFGYARKMLVFIIIILSNVIDQILNANGGVLMVTLFFYITNEGLSIIENCAEMGVLIPKQVAEKLAVIGNDEHKSIMHDLKEEMSDTAKKGNGGNKNG
ncbi:phage holin family protein [Staphylococcus pseudintermedius]|nr:holin [Staphylococcus pseudintermedius]EHC9969661.1 phage holin family protein [Staphylococcus pseudintermedius]EIE3865949.1 phage holin family protein [Staphylococcus pseudintermedius]EIT1243623.1 phage holin family protein [Staphylococcus pseudintermedius]EJD8561572.1 phage holin family protein [Staphylococcus pseudintermedius]